MFLIYKYRYHLNNYFTMKTDEKLQKDVMEELSWDPIVNATEIGVAVKNGIITLTGNVSSYAEKVAAEKAIKRVRGVKAVALDIDVKLSSLEMRTDTEIAENIVDVLLLNTAVPDERIKAKVDNGWVFLEGDVNWQYQKTAAINAVKYLPGVRGVTDLIQIKPNVRTGLLKENIKKALERNADIEANNIDIETIGNTIVLKGPVSSWKERTAIEDAVWATPGVFDVEDKLYIEV